MDSGSQTADSLHWAFSLPPEVAGQLWEVAVLQLEVACRYRGMFERCRGLCRPLDVTGRTLEVTGRDCGVFERNRGLFLRTCLVDQSREVVDRTWERHRQVEEPHPPREARGRHPAGFVSRSQKVAVDGLTPSLLVLCPPCWSRLT